MMSVKCCNNYSIRAIVIIKIVFTAKESYHIPPLKVQYVPVNGLMLSQSAVCYADVKEIISQSAVCYTGLKEILCQKAV